MKNYASGNALIPEYRTDRNGRNVLRHVRSAKASADKAVLTSASPSVAAQVPYEEFSSSFRSFWDRQDISDAGYSDQDFDQRAVASLNKMFSPESELQPFALMTALTSGFNEMLGYEEEEDGRGSIHNIAVFADDIHELPTIRMYIEGLHRTLGYRKDYLLEADDEERAVAVAIMKATSVISERDTEWEETLMMDREKYGVCLSIKDDGILDLVIEYAPRIDDLLALIEDGSPLLPAETLRGMLAHEQKALAKGVL